MKNLIIGVALIAMLGSCKKILNPSEPDHYISGHLYNDCGGTPIKNRGLYIYREGLRGAGETTKGTCTTDSNGYFKMIYRANNAGEPLEFRFANSNYAIVYLPGNPIVNIDNAKLYGISTCNITVKLNVTNPKTTNDTLYVNDYRNPAVNLKVAGPFTSGILYSAVNFNLLVPNYPINNLRLSYSFNLNATTAVDKYFDAVPCKNNIITIDIN